MVYGPVVCFLALNKVFFQSRFLNSSSRKMEKTLPPAQVSPLIKGARWGLLLAGVIYGSSRYNMLYRKNQARLAELEKTRPEREAKAKIEKEKLAKEQIEDLMKSLGTSA